MSKLISQKNIFLLLTLVAAFCWFAFFSSLVPLAYAEEVVQLSVADSPCFMGHKVSVPVKMNQSEGVSGFQLTVNFDPALLTKPEVFKGDLIGSDANWRIETDITPGKLTIIGYNAVSEGLSLDEGALLKLGFKVGENLPPGTEINLNISEYVISDPAGNDIPCVADGGTITVFRGKKGDINADDKVNVLDVVRTVNFALIKSLPNL